MPKLFPPKHAIWAAGGVVTRRRKGRREYLLVHRPRYNDWSLPKGKLDGKESFRQAALREVEEETGHTCEVVTSLGTTAYHTKRRNQKVIRYWLLESVAGKFKPNREVDELVWLTAGKASHVLDYKRDRAMLAWAHTLTLQPRAGRAYLVRHADAGNRAKWSKKDARRPISKRGKKQAAAITDALTRVPVTGVHASSLLRAKQSVAGLSETLGLKLKTDTTLDEGTDLEQLLVRMAEVRSEAVVMCSHGDVIGPYIESLASDGVSLRGGTKWQKGSIWTLDLYKGEVTSASYQAPRP